MVLLLRSSWNFNSSYKAVKERNLRSLKPIASLMTELWRHTLIYVIVRNVSIISKLCRLSYHAIAITSVKFCEIWSSRSAFIEMPLFSIRQLPMTSLTSFYDIDKNLVKKIVECKISKANPTTCEFSFSYHIKKCDFCRCKKRGSGTTINS